MIKARVFRSVLCVLAAAQFAFAYAVENFAQVDGQYAESSALSAFESSGAVALQSSPTTAKSVANGLYMTGPWNSTGSGSSVTITVARIDNTSTTRTSGTLRLELWAIPGATAPARGQTGLTGYRIAADSTLTPLAPQTYYSNLVRPTTATSPPAGTYWMVLFLTEFDPNCTASDHYCSQDTLVRTSQNTFGTAPDYSGAWYNASEPGWGLSVVRGATSGLYGIIMYHYNQSGSPTWYWMSGGSFLGSSYSAPVTLYSGPYFGGSYNSAQVTAPTVGTATIEFASATTGTISYTINGITVTKDIAKLNF